MTSSHKPHQVYTRKVHPKVALFLKQMCDDQGYASKAIDDPESAESVRMTVIVPGFVTAVEVEMLFNCAQSALRAALAQSWI